MMLKRRRLLVLLNAGWATAAVAAASSPARAADASTAPGELKTLGNDRFQIGRVVVDKKARTFSVPAKIHALGKPLEYLATMRGGKKSYESLLELDASGSEINVACLLIGLERDPDLPPWKPAHLGQRIGTRVRLSVAWTDGGKRQQLSAFEALLSADSQAKVKADQFEWAYTGSFTNLDGSQFAADKTGSLIAFIKDPSAVFEAVTGSDLGPYGAVRGNPALPPEGSTVELIVEAVATPSK